RLPRAGESALGRGGGTGNTRADGRRRADVAADPRAARLRDGRLHRLPRRRLRLVGLARAVAGALPPERKHADRPRDEQRKRALVRLARLGIDRGNRALRLPLEDALPDGEREPPDGGVTAIEDAHEVTLPLQPRCANR